MYSPVKLENISANGSVTGRDYNDNSVHNYANCPPQLTHIQILYQKYLNESLDSQKEKKEIIEDLQHFLERPSRYIEINLEHKLINSGRKYLINDAEEAKERAVKRIMKFQHSEVAQEIFAYTLSNILTRFRKLIVPLIKKGADIEAIDNAIFEKIINPIASEAEPSNLGINPYMVDAFIYFLAGNCYINWD